MKAALRQLLDDLDEVARTHEEIGDTDVREAMSAAVHNLLLAPDPNYVLPDHYKMFSPDADLLVKSALGIFFAHPQTKALASDKTAPAARLRAFQDASVQSANGSYYDDYFGHSDDPD